MDNFDGIRLKKLRRGELVGYIGAGVCAATLVYFIVGFAVAQSLGLETLKLVTLIVSPVLLVVFAALSAFCNIKYGSALDREIKEYVCGVLVENAALMHPERDSLNFTLSFAESKAYLRTNGYKERIAFDFSPLGKLSAVRRSGVITAINERLIVTFCRLYERGAKYSSVTFAVEAENKKAKPVAVIADGMPVKHAYKIYLKNK